MPVLNRLTFTRDQLRAALRDDPDFAWNREPDFDGPADELYDHTDSDATYHVATASEMVTILVNLLRKHPVNAGGQWGSEHVTFTRVSDPDGVLEGIEVAYALHPAVSPKPRMLLGLSGEYAESVKGDQSGVEGLVDVLEELQRMVNTGIDGYNDSLTPDDAGLFTVIGLWDGSTPVPVGVVAGEHDVLGNAEHASTYFEGPWATTVTAPDAAAAEEAAVAEMIDTRDDEKGRTVRVTFQPQQWVRDYAVDAGPAVTWDTRYPLHTLSGDTFEYEPWYQDDPDCPQTVKNHRGPFYITRDDTRDDEED